MKYIWFGLILLCLQGCAAPDHQAYFDAYEKTFKASHPYQIHWIQRDDGRIYAQDFGQQNDLPTLILMHGFPDSSHLYDRLVPELKAKYRIITFDFMGWGHSDKPKTHRYDFDSLQADLDAVIQYFKLQQVVLVVHDISGLPGIDWALEHPEQVSGLVLLNTVYHPTPTLSPPESIQLFSTHGFQREVSILATSISDAFWIKRYNEQISKFISKQALRAHFLKILGHQSLDTRHAFFELNGVLQASVQARAKKVPQLQTFAQPVLIAFGNDDHSLNAGVAKDFDRIFPHSELHLLNGAGHFVQIDAPKALAALIDSWVTKYQALSHAAH